MRSVTTGGHWAVRATVLGVALGVLIAVVIGLLIISQRRLTSHETNISTEKLEETEGVSPIPTETASPTATSRQPAMRTISDASHVLTLELPADWPITLNEGRKGIQLSRIAAQTPDFQFREDTTTDGPFTPQRYERGAVFSLHAVRGRSEVGEESARTVGLQAVGPITIDGIAGTFRAGAGISTVVGRNLDAIVYKNGVNYVFVLSYNPDMYPQGETVFRTILASVRFTSTTAPSLSNTPTPSPPTPPPSLYPRPNVFE